MTARPLRFVHASDLHLEQPPYGLSEIPGALRGLLLEAPYQAAKNVFSAAISEEAEFVLLAGDVVDPERAGPQSLVFLAEQFERLADRGIEVYWVSGVIDPVDSIRGLTDWPRNVHFFSGSGVVRHIHRRGGNPAAMLLGAARASSSLVPVSTFHVRDESLTTIAVAHGEVHSLANENLVPSYLALGSHHSKHTINQHGRIAHYPGSPQGRCPSETDAHGCSLVEIDSQGVATVRSMATDVLRWTNERIEIDERISEEHLEARLARRIEGLRELTPGLTLMIQWTLCGAASAVQFLRYSGATERILSRLRERFGLSLPGAWSVSLEVDGHANLPESWYEQETVLGEYLRLSREYEDEPEMSLEFDSLLKERQLAPATFEAVRFDDAHHRQRVLQNATALGAELLSPDDEAF